MDLGITILTSGVLVPLAKGLTDMAIDKIKKVVAKKQVKEYENSKIR